LKQPIPTDYRGLGMGMVVGMGLGLGTGWDAFVLVYLLALQEAFTSTHTAIETCS